MQLDEAVTLARREIMDLAFNESCDEGDPESWWHVVSALEGVPDLAKEAKSLALWMMAESMSPTTESARRRAWESIRKISWALDPEYRKMNRVLGEGQ